jgi:hypothetical protein
MLTRPGAERPTWLALPTVAKATGRSMGVCPADRRQGNGQKRGGWVSLLDNGGAGRPPHFPPVLLSTVRDGPRRYATLSERRAYRGHDLLVRA